MGKHSMVKHAPHRCYHCSAIINSNEPEVKVEGIPYPVRYAHATERGCEDALNRSPYYEKYGVSSEDEAENYYNG